MNTNVNTN